MTIDGKPRVVVVPVRILLASTTATGRQIYHRRRC